MIDFSPSEVEAYYSSRIHNLAKYANGREWRMPCPIHDGRDLNFSINADTGMAHCHSKCGHGWDMLSFEMEISGQPFPKAKSAVFAAIGRPEPPWEERNIAATYDYCDEHGEVMYQVVRQVPKTFRQRRPDSKGGWIWGLGDVEPLPYKLPEVIAAQTVSIVEGEKDVHTLNRLGVVATCNSGGAGNFQPVLAKWFAGKNVFIFPDNDEPGRKHALKVASILAPVARLVKIVELPGLPQKGDVTDFVAAGGTREQIAERVKASQRWTPEFQFAEDAPSDEDKWVHTYQGELQKVKNDDIAFWDQTRLQGIETPWKKLSRALGGGMRNGEIYIIGANQGAGKTSLAIQFVIAALLRQVGVLYFSMEMDARSMFQRMVSIEARVDLNALYDDQMEFRFSKNPEAERLAGKRVGVHMEKLRAAQSILAPLPLIVSCKPGVSPEYIVEETARLRRRQKIGLVVVDHMQLMASTGSERGDYEKFTSISRHMKTSAVEANAPLLVLSQTSRRNSAEKRYELDCSDLRGSGALEEDAAAVMMEYEDHEHAEACKLDGSYPYGPVLTYLRLAKNRFGISGARLKLNHIKTCTRFDLVEEEERKAA